MLHVLDLCGPLAFLMISSLICVVIGSCYVYGLYASNDNKRSMNDSFVENALKNIREKSSKNASAGTFPITINFHPDRMTRENKPLLLAIAEDGELKSQFETGTSNGGLTAYQGGDRWKWEQRVFDRAYDGAPMNQRPKYGALNYQHYPMGASPRFGSSYFQLKPHVQSRTSFCYPDSYFEPENFAVAERGVSELVSIAQSDDDVDQLDDYIEAHIHGVLQLQRDVECLVLDPIYRGTEIEQQAKQLKIPLKWHGGFRLHIEQMRQFPDYRGAGFITLAEKIADGGVIHPRLLGNAVNNGDYNEQDIKKVWHYLARFGHP